jgi:chlorite dismutase
MGAPSKNSATRRQIVSFSFFRVQPEWRRLSINDRREHKEEALRVLQRWENEDMRILTYSTGGMRAECDFLLWRICYSLDCLNTAHTDLLRTQLGGYLEVAHAFLGMTMRSQYLIGQEHESNHALRGYIKPGAGKYLVIYPFTKTREWYHRPFEDRQRIVHEQIKAAQEFKHVRMNTVYSFGLDDNEFVIALESDHPEEFVDMGMRLREVENSMYLLRDTPRFTALRMSPQEMLERIG